MPNREKVPFPRIWTLVAGMPSGPFEIPEPFRHSEQASIVYVLDLMKTRIKGRACIEWEQGGKRSATHFLRDKNGGSYYK